MIHSRFLSDITLEFPYWYLLEIKNLSEIFYRHLEKKSWIIFSQVLPGVPLESLSLILSLIYPETIPVTSSEILPNIEPGTFAGIFSRFSPSILPGIFFKDLLPSSTDFSQSYCSICKSTVILHAIPNGIYHWISGIPLRIPQRSSQNLTGNCSGEFIPEFFLEFLLELFQFFLPIPECFREFLSNFFQIFILEFLQVFSRYPEKDSFRIISWIPS